MEIINGRKIFTPSEVNASARKILEKFSFWVKGEVFEPKYKEGYVYFYFILKDKFSQIKCVAYPDIVFNLNFKLEQGKEVLVFGKLSLYQAKGEYQLKAEIIQEVGAGDLQRKLEALKNKLQSEGLFDERHKRPLPQFPERIGVITSFSEDSGAWPDIRKIISQRYPCVELVVADVFVEGNQAPQSIINAIKSFNSLKNVDFIILTRGGGPIESLMAFNDEGVARAVFASDLPILCAVGHEKDVSIAELCADVRASTPSNAAEIAVRDKKELLQWLDELNLKIERVGQKLLRFPEELGNIFHMVRRRFSALIQKKEEQAESIITEMKNKAGNLLRRKEIILLALAEKIKILDPINTLSRGYSIVYNLPQRRIIKDAREVEEGGHVFVRLFRGEIYTKVYKKTCKYGG